MLIFQAHVGVKLRVARRDKHAVGVHLAHTLTQTSESIRTRGVFHGCHQDEDGRNSFRFLFRLSAQTDSGLEAPTVAVTDVHVF